MAMTKQQLARRVREVAYLEGDFVLRSGKRSSYYLDKYLFETDPAILTELGRRLAEHAGDVDQIAGAELGGVPLAAATAMASGKSYVIIRNAKKDYGTSKLMEGKLSDGARVLLVEDEPVLLAQLSRLLEDEGHTVSAVSTGGEALERLRSERYDIVFTDVGMTPVSGWEVASLDSVGIDRAAIESLAKEMRTQRRKDRNTKRAL